MACCFDFDFDVGRGSIGEVLEVLEPLSGMGMDASTRRLNARRDSPGRICSFGCCCSGFFRVLGGGGGGGSLLGFPLGVFFSFGPPISSSPPRFRFAPADMSREKAFGVSSSR